MTSNIRQFRKYTSQPRRQMHSGKASPVQGSREKHANTGLREVTSGEDIHCVPIGRLCEILQINLQKGLTQTQVNINRNKYGRNLYAAQKTLSPAYRYFKCLFGPFELLLLAGAAVCFATSVLEAAGGFEKPEENVEMGFLLIAVTLIEVTLKFYQESRMQSKLRSFHHLLPEYATVIRNGLKVMVEVSEVVVGDVVELYAGDKVPADILLTKASRFKVNHASMTGESRPSLKISACTSANSMETKNMVYFSTTVLEGTAQGIVISVGEHTLMGEIVKLTNALPTRDTPLSRDLSHFVLVLSIWAMFCGIVCASTAFALLQLKSMMVLVFCTAVVIANIPVGVACFIPMFLSICAKKMANNSCMVKSLESVETLGSATVICADKTGTLTQNRMTVSRLWFDDRVVIESGDLSPDFNLDYYMEPGFQSLVKVAVLCNNASVLTGQEDVDDMKFEGDAIDGAILKYIYRQGFGSRKIQGQYKAFYEVPFNPVNKFHMFACKAASRYQKRSDEIYIVMKGAPEKILAICDRILLNQREFDLDFDWRDKIDHICENFGKLGERVIAFCDLLIHAEDLGSDFDWENNYFDVLSFGFRFIGVVSLYDPPRPGVKESISSIRQAGVKVVMITGDHPITAKALARKVGIISPGNHTVEEIAESNFISVRDVNPNSVNVIVINGTQLGYLNQVKLSDILRNHQEIVFSRMLPHQKLQVVSALQACGEIVAVTGDGVNDAPALKKANIGIAMGKSGTQISKDSADLILVDDNFASIPYAIEQGRTFLTNLKKCCFLGLTDTTSCVLTFVATVILGLPTPLETTSMLLLAVVLDALPAVSFAFCPPEGDEMDQIPRSLSQDHMVNKRLISLCYGQFGMIEALAGFCAYFVTFACNGFLPTDIIGSREKWSNEVATNFQDYNGSEWDYPARMRISHEASTAFFIAVVMCQIVNAINLSRADSVLTYRRFTKNKFLWMALCLMLGLVLILIYGPLAPALNLSPVRWTVWLLPVPFMFLTLCWSEVIKTLFLPSSSAWLSSEFRI